MWQATQKLNLHWDQGEAVMSSHPVRRWWVMNWRKNEHCKDADEWSMPQGVNLVYDLLWFLVFLFVSSADHSNSSSISSGVDLFGWMLLQRSLLLLKSISFFFLGECGNNILKCAHGCCWIEHITRSFWMGGQLGALCVHWFKHPLSHLATVSEKSTLRIEIQSLVRTYFSSLCSFTITTKPTNLVYHQGTYHTRTFECIGLFYAPKKNQIWKLSTMQKLTSPKPSRKRILRWNNTRNGGSISGT